MTLVVTEETVLRIRDLDARFNFAPDSRMFDCRFIEPGLINYTDHVGARPGIELLKKETIDKYIHTVIGNPVTIGHVVITANNRLEFEEGIVQEWYYNPEDGWYYVRGVATTPEAIEGMKTRRPSCGYLTPRNSGGPGGSYHGIKYDREITELCFNHLAIVSKPRYEGSYFRLNSLVNPSNMNLLKLFRKFVTRSNGSDGSPTETSTEVSHEIDGNTEVEVDGKMVRLNQLTEVFVKANAPQPPDKIAGEDTVEIGGKRVPVTELVECFRKNSAPSSPAPAAPAAVPPAPVAAAPTPEVVARNNNAFFTLHKAREAGAQPIPGGIASNSGSLDQKVKTGSQRY